MTTERQIEANRTNALSSTGPRTPLGKAESSANALVHGMYGSRPVAIPRGAFAEDQAEVSALHDAIVEALAPRDAVEQVQASRIAMSFLRLRRVSRYEAAALGDDGEPFAADDYSPGSSPGDGARAMLATLAGVTMIEARTSQGLDRALLMYERLKQRPLDDNDQLTFPE
jgi:hypothetical protein